MNNNVIIEFDSMKIKVQDPTNKMVVLEGKEKGDLNKLPIEINRSSHSMMGE